LEPNSFSCTCGEGFQGELCELDSACFSSPCLNGGTCSDYVNNNTAVFECVCSKGTSGLFCEVDDNECASSPCQAEGTSACTDLGLASFECTCEANWSGSLCELSEARTYELQYVMAANEDMFVLSLTLEEDLEAEYPGTNITVIPVLVVISNTNITVFRISFLLEKTDSVNSTLNSTLPLLSEIEAVMSKGTYMGSVIYFEVEVTDVPNDDGEVEADDDGTSAVLRLLVVIGAVLAVVMVAVILACRRKGHVKMLYNMPT
jgi:hypothetical protein